MLSGADRRPLELKLGADMTQKSIGLVVCDLGGRGRFGSLMDSPHTMQRQP